jgi:PAS domain S-box-containing protein
MTPDQLRSIRPQEVGIGRLFESVRDAVILADTETQRILLWNQAATEIFGYSTSEARKLRIEVLVPECLKARHRRGIAHYANTGHGPFIDSHNLLSLPAVKKSGEEISIEMSLSPIRDVPELGEMRLALAVIRDVTERKNTEKALRESHTLLHSIVEGTADAIFLKDVRSCYLMVNDSAAMIIGSPVDEILGKNDAELLPSGMAHSVMEDDRRVIKAGEPLAFEEEAVVEGVMRTYPL